MPKRKSPGSPKGQPKPLTRTFEPGFPSRLKEAIGSRTIPELAKKIGCSRAVLGNHINGKSKTIDGILLIELCVELNVSPFWLVKNNSNHTGMSKDENALLRLYRKHDQDGKILIIGIAGMDDAAEGKI